MIHRVILAPGLVPGDFPFALALAVGAIAIAVPEMSKTPESPPGFYGFDPLNLKDAPRKGKGLGVVPWSLSSSHGQVDLVSTEKKVAPNQW